MARSPRSLCTFAAAALLLAGCGGSDGGAESADAVRPAEPPAEQPQPSPAEPVEPTPEVPSGPQDAPPPDPAEPHEPPADPAAPVASVPADRLDLASWKLTLPVDTPHAGAPDEIRQPELATFALEPFFALTAAKDGVSFRAPIEGATTSSSDYPRSELREMTADGSDEASWSTTSGTHTLEIRQAITHLPEVKAHVVAGQIHDADDDVIMIRLEGEHLFVEGGGEELGTLDDHYVPGRIFTVKIVAGGGRIRVDYDGVPKLDIARAASGCYFKAGAYTQSNVAKGDAPGAYGEVVIYDLRIRTRNGVRR